MFKFLTNNFLGQLISQSDGMTLVILLILLVLSITCWAIFFYKLIILRIKERHARDVMVMLENISTFESLRALANSIAYTVPGYFLSSNISFLKMMVDDQNPVLDEQDFAYLQDRIDQSLDDIIHKEYSYLPVLATTAAVSTLLGLLGTVWGLIHAFLSISEKQSADIIAIAPGIAEALVTTLVGLMVAIPASVMYHYIVTRVRNLEYEYMKVADRLTWYAKKFFTA